MLLTKEVEVGLAGSTIKYYEDRNYKIPREIDSNGRFTVKKGSKIIVKVEDLPRYSKAVVEVGCDGEGCTKSLNVPWQNYVGHVKPDGTYYCRNCSNNLIVSVKRKKTLLKNGKSFEQWCFENNRQDLLDRWDYELNTDKRGNSISPNEVNIKSGAGHYFKCLEYHEHESESKNINCLTNGKQKDITCRQCNVISITHPEMIKYLVNKEDGLKYSIGSRDSIPLKCPNCGYKKKSNLYRVYRQGFGCPKCSDGIPYPEKFVLNFLEQLDCEFVTQLTKTTFKWCSDYKYDFYIPSLKMIIETHGEQHYEERNKYWQSLQEVQENDRLKEKLAKENGIKFYIVIDCRRSNMEWIKNSIMQSELTKILSFKKDHVNWLKCHEYACNSLTKEACDLWNDGIKSTKKIGNILKVDPNTIVRYLKQGAILGWCIYNPNIEKEQSLKLIHKSQCKKVICITTGETFHSITKAGEYYNISPSHISKCCRKETKYSGKSTDGTKLVWMYYREYINSEDGE